MKISIDNLESLDAATLRVMLIQAAESLTVANEAAAVTSEQLSAANEVIVAKNEQLSAANETIRIANLNIKILQLKILGINLERRTLPLPEMLDLFFDAGIEVTTNEVVGAKAVVSVPKARAKRKPEENRQELPAELPRVIKILDIPENEKVCAVTGKPLLVLSTVITEMLEIEPAKFYVLRYERPQYVCKEHPEEGVLAMTLPSRVIPKGIPGESLLAFILTRKFIDHMPLDRISKELERSGMVLSRKTLSDWVLACERVLEPLRLALMRKVLNSRIINADETTYKVLQNHKSGPKITGYLWGFVGDRKHLLFEWNSGRSSVHPMSLLRGAHCEWLQTDAYSGYGPVIKANPSMLAVGCWAHVRRKFAEAEKIGEIAATPYLDFIGTLYAIEKDARERKLSASEIQALRTEKSLPVLALLASVADSDTSLHLPKSPMGRAISYMLNHWAALISYTTDGDLEIDNNIIERAIRPVAVGRKNWMFSGSESGAQIAALIISLVGTCKLCSVEPSMYLRNVLRLLPNFQGKDYADLLPDAIASTLEDIDKLP